MHRPASKMRKNWNCTQSRSILPILKSPTKILLPSLRFCAWKDADRAEIPPPSLEKTVLTKSLIYVIFWKMPQCLCSGQSFLKSRTRTRSTRWWVMPLPSNMRRRAEGEWCNPLTTWEFHFIYVYIWQLEDNIWIFSYSQVCDCKPGHCGRRGAHCGEGHRLPHAAWIHGHHLHHHHTHDNHHHIPNIVIIAVEINQGSIYVFIQGWNRIHTYVFIQGRNCTHCFKSMKAPLPCPTCTKVHHLFLIFVIMILSFVFIFNHKNHHQHWKMDPFSFETGSCFIQTLYSFQFDIAQKSSLT